MRRWLLMILPTVVWAQQELVVPPGQVDLDDVWCTMCHEEQGEDFGQGVHYQRGLLLCNDCHGGDTDEAREEEAKAPETGFIGKPAREDIAGICARCHKGPAEFFRMGPHADPADRDNPTCITCHQNHNVADATLTLMDTTCAVCHGGEDDVALERATGIQLALREAEQNLHVVAARFDSLGQIDAGLQRSAGLLAGAGASLRQVEARTHSLDMEIIDESVAAVDEEIAAVQQLLDESEASRRYRRWAVGGVWVFVVANVTLFWMKRRQL